MMTMTYRFMLMQGSTNGGSHLSLYFSPTSFFLIMDTISDLYVKRHTQPIITKFGIKTHIISKYRYKN